MKAWESGQMKNQLKWCDLWSPIPLRIRQRMARDFYGKDDKLVA